MSGNTVQIKGTFDDQVSGPVDKLRDKFNTLGKSEGAKSVLQGVGIGAGISAFNFLEGAVGKVVGTIGDAVKSAEDYQVVSARLDTALTANVKGWDGNRTAIDGYLKKQADLGFGMVETTTSFAQLVAATGDVTKAQTFQAAAMDLARLKGISLADATDALTKVEGGSYRILKSLGIQLAAHATQQQALAAVEKIAAGQKDAYAKTEAGNIDILKAKNEELATTLGTKLLPAANVVTEAQIRLLDSIGPTADAFGALADATDTHVAPSLEVAGKKAHGMVDALYELTGGVVDLRDRLQPLDLQLQQNAAHLLHLSDAQRFADQTTADLANSMKNGVTDADLAAQALEKAGEAAYYVRVQADRATPKVRDFFDVFNAAVGKGNIAQTTLQIEADTQAIRDAHKAVQAATPGTKEHTAAIAAAEKALAATKVGTKAYEKALLALHAAMATSRPQSKAYKDALLSLAVAQGQLAQDTINLRDEQAKLFLLKPDKSNQAALKKWFDSIGLQVNNLQGDAKAAYDALMKLLGINVSARQTLDNQKGTGGGKGKHPKASAGGGWVGLGGPELRLVGEEGPEYVIPNHRIGRGGGSGIPGGGMGSAPIIIPVPSHWSPGEQQKWARDALKALLPEMKRMGLL